MLFNSIEYLFFFIPIVFTIYFLLNKFKFYNCAKIFLLIASLYFYASYKLDYLYIIVFSVLFNYGISRIIKRNYSLFINKFSLIFAIAGNVGVLLFFKYFQFLSETLSKFDFTYLSTFNIIMPLGISFFIIQQISYIVDYYKGTIKDSSLLDYALFVCFFPQLIAGPIVRHNEMIPQFNNLKNRVINQSNIYKALFLITVGLLKKTVLADGFVPFIDYVTVYRTFDDFYISWLFGIAKVLQGYFDFSSYCDLALGSAFLFNISLPWNFNSPFQVSNITEFWNRWNMTLIRFLKTYIYRPLTNANQTLFKTFFNIVFVFTVMGIWIGFNQMSIVYGLSNGICVFINKLWSSLKIKANKYIGRIITFITIVFTTQFLMSKSIGDSVNIIKSMLLLNDIHVNFRVENFNIIYMPVPPAMVKLNILLLILGLIVVFMFKNSNVMAKIYSKANNPVYTFILVIAFVYAVLSITKSTEFIYFAF